MIYHPPPIVVTEITRISPSGLEAFLMKTKRSVRNRLASLLDRIAAESHRHRRASQHRPMEPRIRAYPPRTETLEVRYLLAFGPPELVSVNQTGDASGNAASVIRKSGRKVSTSTGGTE